MACSSGNCQIIHWRQIHKQECQILETPKVSSSPLTVSVDEFSQGNGLCYENMNSQFFGHNLVKTLKENTSSDNLVHPQTGIGASATENCAFFNNSHVSILERRTSHKSNRETWRRNSETIHNSSIDSSGCKATSSPFSSVVSKELFVRQKVCMFNFDIPLFTFSKLIIYLCLIIMLNCCCSQEIMTILCWKKKMQRRLMLVAWRHIYMEKMPQEAQYLRVIITKVNLEILLPQETAVDAQIHQIHQSLAN